MVQSTEQPSRPWRELFGVDPAAEMFPPLSHTELEVLAADIKERGMLVPVIMRRHDGPAGPGVPEYDVVGGRSRLDALQLAGLPLFVTDDGKPVPNFPMVVLGDDVDPYAVSISTNLKRRHLTLADRREAVAKYLAIRHDQSDRQIGAMFGLDHKTVGVIREKGVASGEFPQTDRTIGADGRSRRVKRTPRKTAAAPSAPARTPPPGTGTATTAQRAAALDQTTETRRDDTDAVGVIGGSGVRTYDMSPELIDESADNFVAVHGEAETRSFIPALAARVGGRTAIMAEQTKLEPADDTVAASQTLSCSFCAKSAAQVEVLIVAPDRTSAMICNECVELCSDIIAARRAAKAKQAEETTAKPAPRRKRAPQPEPEVAPQPEVKAKQAETTSRTSKPVTPPWAKTGKLEERAALLLQAIEAAGWNGLHKYDDINPLHLSNAASNRVIDAKIRLTSRLDGHPEPPVIEVGKRLYLRRFAPTTEAEPDRSAPSVSTEERVPTAMQEAIAHHFRIARQQGVPEHLAVKLAHDKFADLTDEQIREARITLDSEASPAPPPPPDPKLKRPEK